MLELSCIRKDWVGEIFVRHLLICLNTLFKHCFIKQAIEVERKRVRTLRQVRCRMAGACTTAYQSVLCFNADAIVKRAQYQLRN